ATVPLAAEPAAAAGLSLAAAGRGNGAHVPGRVLGPLGEVGGRSRSAPLRARDGLRLVRGRLGRFAELTRKRRCRYGTLAPEGRQEISQGQACAAPGSER